jgi:hypothetical protein
MLRTPSASSVAMSGVVVVPLGEQGAPACGLAAALCGDVTPLVVEESHLHLVDDVACAPQTDVPRVAQRRPAQRPCLVRTVELQHGRAGLLLEGCRAVVGHGLAAREQDPQGAEVASGERGGIEHHDELGADGSHHTDPMALDLCGKEVRIETGHEHTGSTEECGRGVGGPDAEAEGGRQGAEKDVLLREVGRLDGEPVEVEPALQVVDDTLRQARRARGGVQQEGVRGLDASACERPCVLGPRSVRLPVDLDGGIELELPFADQVEERLPLVPERLRESGGLELAVGSPAQQRRGTRAAGEVEDLGEARSGADSDRHEARLLTGHEGDVDSGSVGQQHRHPLAGREPGLGEKGGQTIGARRVVTPGERVVGAVERHRLGHAPGMAIDESGEGL